MREKIYQSTPSITQSGFGKKNIWLFEICTSEKSGMIDPKTNWTSSINTLSQIKMSFGSFEEAVNFAKSHNIDYDHVSFGARKMIKKSYSDNFLNK